MAGPFSGYGIEPDLRIENIPTSTDPYYQALRTFFPLAIFSKTYSLDNQVTKDCFPYFEYFIRNDNGLLQKPLHNRGTKNKKGEPKSDLQPYDLTAPHSRTTSAAMARKIACKARRW